MHRYTRVVRAIHRRAYLASLEEYQEHDSEWALSRILNLVVKVNEHNPMCMGCYFEMSRKIATKRAVINVYSTDNACFAWPMIATSTKSHVDRKTSYLHYMIMLNLTDIEFPITFKEIPKFERDVDQRIWHRSRFFLYGSLKRDKHANLLYLDLRNNNIRYPLCVDKKSISSCNHKLLEMRTGNFFTIDKYNKKSW